MLLCTSWLVFLLPCCITCFNHTLRCPEGRFNYARISFILEWPDGSQKVFQHLAHQRNFLCLELRTSWWWMGFNPSVISFPCHSSLGVIMIAHLMRRLSVLFLLHSHDNWLEMGKKHIFMTPYMAMMKSSISTWSLSIAIHHLTSCLVAPSSYSQYNHQFGGSYDILGRHSSGKCWNLFPPCPHLPLSHSVL